MKRGLFVPVGALLIFQSGTTAFSSTRWLISGRAAPNSRLRVSQNEADRLINDKSTGGERSTFGDSVAAVSNNVLGNLPNGKTNAPSNTASPPPGQELQPNSLPPQRNPPTMSSPNQHGRVEPTDISVDDSIPSWFPSDKSKPKKSNQDSQFRSPAKTKGPLSGMFSREAIAKVANGSGKAQTTYRQSYQNGRAGANEIRSRSTNSAPRGTNIQPSMNSRQNNYPDGTYWWERDTSDFPPNMAASMASYRVPYDNTGQHLAFLVAGTLWWYVLSSLKMIADPPQDFFGIGEELIQVSGVLVMCSQVAMFAGCSKLSKAENLAEAQQMVCMMAAIFIPVNLFVSLINPFEAKGISVLACAEVTMCLGVFLSHYLRKASYRELSPYQTRMSSVQDHSFRGILQYMREYRPPPRQQAVHSAVALTRAFTAFAIATSTLGQYLVYKDYSNPIAMGALLIVTLHSGLECALITVYPGARLDKFTSFLSFETALYSIHMLAATMATAQAVFSNKSTLDTAWDQWLFLWLFLNALIKVMAKSTGLLSRIDFDRFLGLADLDKGISR